MYRLEHSACVLPSSAVSRRIQLVNIVIDGCSLWNNQNVTSVTAAACISLDVVDATQKAGGDVEIDFFITYIISSTQFKIKDAKVHSKFLHEKKLNVQ